MAHLYIFVYSYLSIQANTMVLYCCQNMPGKLRHCLLPLAFVSAGCAFAEVPALFAGADLQQGSALIANLRCNACHQQRVGGDGSAMYRPGERVTHLGALRGMVEACNMQLNFGLFPDEVTSIAAVLNRDHYRFTK